MMGVFVMSKRSSISLEVKLHVVQRCIQNESNPNYEAKQLGVAKRTVTDWIRKYKAEGYEGLRVSNGWKGYSEELKFAAIRDVLSGASLWGITKKYNILSSSVLRSWIS